MDTEDRGHGWQGTTLAGVRVAMGAAGLLAPRLVQRLALLDEEPTTAVRVWMRFWATRAFGLGIGYLLADEDVRRHLLRMGLVVDGLDTAFLGAMATSRGAPRRTLAWLALITGASTAADVAELATRGASGPAAQPG